MPAFLGAIATGGLGLFGGAAGLVGNLLSMVGSTLMSGVHLLVSTGTAVISATLNAIMAIPGILMGVLNTINNALGQVVSIVLRLGSALTGLITGALSGLAKAIQVTTKDLLDLGRNALQLSGSTGLGLADSARIQRHFAAVGVGADVVNGSIGQMNPADFAMQAQFWGLPTSISDPRLLPMAAGLNQRLMSGGWFDQMQAQQMREAFGWDTPQMRGVLMMRPQTIQSQIGFSNRVYGSARLADGAGIRDAAEVVPALLTRIGIVFDALKTKLAVAFLPVVERVLNVLSSAGSEAVSGIADIFEKAARWMYVDAPILLADGVVRITESLVGFIDWLTKFSSELAEWLPSKLSAITGNIASQIEKFAGVFDQAGHFVIQSIGNFLIGITNTVANWALGIGKFLISLSSPGNPFASFLQMMADFTDTLGFFVRMQYVQTSGITAQFDSIAAVIHDLVEVVLTIPRALTYAIAQILKLVPDTLLAAVPKIGGTLVNLKAAFIANAPQSPQDLVPNLISPAVLPNSNPIAAMQTAWNQSAWMTPNYGPQMAQWLANSVPNGVAFNHQVRVQRDQTIKAIQDAMQGATGVLHTATDWINARAKDIDPIGGRVGRFLQPYVRDFHKEMKAEVQPRAHSALEAARRAQERIGTREQRLTEYERKSLELQQQAVDELRKSNEAANGPGVADRTAAYMLMRYAMETGAAVRRGGGGYAG